MSQSGEDHLPSEVHNSPQLGIEYTKRTGVPPQSVDDTSERHQRCSSTLRATARVSQGGKLLSERVEVLIAELRHVDGLGGGSRRCISCGDERGQRLEEVTEEHVGPLGVEVFV